jgi:hypothetical protein
MHVEIQPEFAPMGFIEGIPISYLSPDIQPARAQISNHLRNGKGVLASRVYHESRAFNLFRRALKYITAGSGIIERVDLRPAMNTIGWRRSGISYRNSDNVNSILKSITSVNLLKNVSPQLPFSSIFHRLYGFFSNDRRSMSNPASESRFSPQSFSRAGQGYGEYRYDNGRESANANKDNLNGLILRRFVIAVGGLASAMALAGFGWSRFYDGRRYGLFIICGAFAIALGGVGLFWLTSFSCTLGWLL